MYQALTFIHSTVRWFVVLSLLFTILRSWLALQRSRPFNAMDNAARHWTATIAHIQLVVGILFYVKSPVIRYYWQHFSTAVKEWELTFYGLFHISMMLTAIALITAGSALAKRRVVAEDKFRTMFRWYTIALILIFLAVPWPFSPLAHRPLFR